jgi:SAM-dependent methyltransferase
MTVLDEILEIKDWRHPYDIPGQTLVKEYYRPWHPWRFSVDKPNLERILGGFEGKRFLDVGCNDGWYSFAYEKEGAEVFGVDARAEAIRRAELIREYFASGANFVCGDVQELTGADRRFAEPFDATLFYGLLYHLSDPIGTLNRISAMTSRVIAVQTWMNGEDRKPILRIRKEEVGLPGSGMSEIVTTPSQAAVVMMLKNAGFNRVFRASPPSYNQIRKLSKKTRPSWHFGFFYGVKGDCPPLVDAVEIDESTPPLNPYGPVDRAIDLARRSAKRWLGRSVYGE